VVRGQVHALLGYVIAVVDFLPVFNFYNGGFFTSMLSPSGLQMNVVSPLNSKPISFLFLVHQ
jgi:hypothetical protein